jgi:hypothetical protein
MDPAFFYTYVNTLVHYDGASKYNAIIAFMNDPSIIDEYKRIPEVAIETEHAITLINGVNGMNNQVNNQRIHEQNNNKRIHNNNEDEYLDNPPPPPRLRRN